jgi:hypothetical protein
MIKVIETEHGIVKFESHPVLGVVMHVDMKGWSKGTYLATLLVFKEMVEYLHDNGCDNIYAVIADDDEKNEKFAALYGFELTDMPSHLNGDRQYNIWVYNYEAD